MRRTRTKLKKEVMGRVSPNWKAPTTAILVNWSSNKMMSAMPNQSQTPEPDLKMFLLRAMLDALSKQPCFTRAMQIAVATATQGGMRRVHAHIGGVVPATLALGVLADRNLGKHFGTGRQNNV
ncbi:MAG: hypothetical protein RI994_1969 [Pseudomonadota bacterium]